MSAQVTILLLACASGLPLALAPQCAMAAGSLWKLPLALAAGASRLPRAYARRRRSPPPPPAPPPPVPETQLPCCTEWCPAHGCPAICGAFGNHGAACLGGEVIFIRPSIFLHSLNKKREIKA